MALAAREFISGNAMGRSVGKVEETGRLGSGWVLAWLVSTTLFTMLFVDGLMNDRAFFDLSLMKAIQAVEFSGDREVEEVLDYLTGSPGIFLVWGGLFMVFVLLRQWSAAFAFGFIPPTVVINELFGMMVGRSRPHLDELERTSSNWEELSFPSGHTQAGVMVFGFLLVMAARIENAALRWTVQGGSLFVIVGTPLARVWTGAHWPTDVMGAVTLGFALLLPIMAMERRLHRAWDGLPLIKAGVVEVPAGAESTSALTSTVIFDRTGGTVTKVYRPGIVPRAIYWAAFQAPFGYEANDRALDAAIARRNLARKLTEFWFGAPRVAEAIGVTDVAGRAGLVSELVEGRAPRDRRQARAFLADLRGKFDAAGLPTWQIDPRQPRAVDNVLETPAGYTIVDLESGLVAPLASRTAWRRAFRRHQVPLYDDVDFATTRAYLAGHESRMVATMGAAWVAELRVAIDAAESSASAWHASEPRLWSALLDGLTTGFGYRTWPARSRRLAAQSQEKATGWIVGQVEQNAAEGRLTATEADALRAQVGGANFQRALPYLGGHVAISVVLRFPFGSIARAAAVAGALGWAFGQFALRRIGRDELREAMRLHAPRVLLVSMIPGIGTFAYLVSPSVQTDAKLLRLLSDASLRKVPWGLYERSGTSRWVALPVRTAGPVPGAALPAPVAASRPAPPAPAPVAAGWRSRLGDAPVFDRVMPGAAVAFAVPPALRVAGYGGDPAGVLSARAVRSNGGAMVGGIGGTVVSPRTGPAGVTASLRPP